MPNSQLLLLNKERRAIRSRMARDAGKYAQASAKMLGELGKLSKDELSAFLKKNPDVLVDIAGGVAAHAGVRAKNAAGTILREFRKDFNSASIKGKRRAGVFGAELEKKGMEYLKKLLSF
ncbi:MAG: hypothetical protein Q7S09_01145 [bacterium]|nr:hypothetical protein [bacterium]